MSNSWRVLVDGGFPPRDKIDNERSEYVLTLLDNHKTQEVLSFDFEKGIWTDNNEDREYDCYEIFAWQHLPNTI